MRKYRIIRSPAVIVEAEQLDETNVDELCNLTQGQIINEGRGEFKHEALNVKTPNGKERLHPGMYLVKVGSDFYCMAAVNFEQRYELIPSGEAASMPTQTDNPWDGIPRIKDVP